MGERVAGGDSTGVPSLVTTNDDRGRLIMDCDDGPARLVGGAAAAADLRGRSADCVRFRIGEGAAR